MITYYGTTISPNQIETQEGFLICRNVPIARTGEQKYLRRDIDPESNSNEEVTLIREEKEVFDPAAIASFEGKPVTNNHPNELLKADDVRFFERGHAQNVRRGEGEFSDYLVADLHIHDAELIEAVKNGKREISCGYNYVCEERDGKFYQTNLRGNHVAVVDKARAGETVAIMDSIQPAEETAERTTKMGKIGTLLKDLANAISGKTDEEIEKLTLEDEADVSEGGEVLTTEEQAEVTSEVMDAPDDRIDECMRKIDALTDLVSKLIPAEETTEETTETISDALESMGEESTVIEADAKDACKALDSATQAYILKSVNDAVNGITNPDEKQRVSDAIINAVRVAKDDVTDIVEAQGANPTVMKVEDIQKAYDAMNPHKKER